MGGATGPVRADLMMSTVPRSTTSRPCDGDEIVLLLASSRMLLSYSNRLHYYKKHAMLTMYMT